MADFSDIQQSLQKKQYAPVYFMDGDEPFYIDELLRIFEEEILPPEERDFNLITFYGKEINSADVVNAARRFPMFSERMVVVLREAAQLKGLAELESYFASPSPSTILVIDHRLKNLDKRTAFAKTVKDKTVYFSSSKIKEEDLPFWISNYAKSQGYKIPDREAEMLALYLGNDLQKISNELEKIKINEPERKVLNAQLIERYIGISKEYNPMDLPSVMLSGDRKKLGRMLSYFNANPKVAPMPMLIGLLYGYLNKLMLCHYTKPDFAKDRKLGIWNYHRGMAQKISLLYIHKCFSILEEYSHKSVGVDNTNSDVALLKEMCGKINNLLSGYA